MEIDIEASKFSSSDAQLILERLYHIYHGDNRSVDSKGEITLLPILENFGFLGLGYVIETIVNSHEMIARAKSELDTIWKEKFNRFPNDDERNILEKRLRLLRYREMEEIKGKLEFTEQLRKRASQLTAEGKPEEAEKLVDRAIEEGIPASWEIWHEKGFALYRQDKYLESITPYQKSITLNASDGWLWSCEDLKWCYSKLAEQDRKYLIEGLRYFRSVVDIFPTRWIASHECGYFAWKSNQVQEAIESYHQAIDKQTDLTWAWSAIDLSHVYNESGKQDEGMSYFSDLIIHRSEIWAAWHALAWLQFIYKKDQQSAIENYKRAIELNPNGGWIWSWNDLGRCYRELGAYEKSYGAYRKAVKVDPANHYAWQALGSICKQLHKWDEAYKYLKEAIRLNPGYNWSWLSLANYYRDNPNPRPLLAWQAYQKVLSLNPNDKEALIGIEKLDGDQWVELRKLMVKRFNLDDIKIIAFDTKVENENLVGDRKDTKITALIEECIRTDRIKKLLQVITEYEKDLKTNFEP